jgi:hypothetical protein
MHTLRWLIPCIAAVYGSSSAAMCSADITTGDVDAVTRALQAQLPVLTGDSTMQLMVREGVVEQTAELQVVKLLIGLRDGVTGRDNQLKVRDALRAVMRSTADTNQALRELAASEAKGGLVADERTALLGVLDRELALVACEESTKKETPAADGR